MNDGNMVGGHTVGDLGLGATLATVALAAVSETSRARKMAKGDRQGSSMLPSPVPVLPRWIPFIGGHALQMERVTCLRQGTRMPSRMRWCFTLCAPIVFLFYMRCRDLSSSDVFGRPAEQSPGHGTPRVHVSYRTIRHKVELSWHTDRHSRKVEGTRAMILATQSLLQDPDFAHLL